MNGKQIILHNIYNVGAAIIVTPAVQIAMPQQSMTTIVPINSRLRAHICWCPWSIKHNLLSKVAEIIHTDKLMTRRYHNL